MKKKIFHFVSTNIISGLENMVINISILVKGYDYTYVSPDGPINNYLNKLGIKHISINKMTPFYVRKILKKYKPDIVQGHDVKASISLALNYSICKKKNIKVISELHNDDPRMHKLTLRSLLYQLSTKRYNKIVVVSKSVIDNYIFRKNIQDKVIIIDNVISPLRIQNSLNNNIDLVQRWDCIFIGRLVNQKNPLSFVKIIYGLKKYKKDISAIMIGEGPLKKTVKNLIVQYNLSNNIIMTGFKTNPYKYLNNSKILIMPSIFEGFGLVALESLIIGTPVVASYVGGLKNIINTKCGNFALNKDEFIQQINLLLNNNDVYKSKVHEAIKHSKKINDVNKFIKKYKSIYNESS